MKNFNYLILALTFSLSIHNYSQEKDSLIQLYPGLGDTLDLFDRNYFEMFQNIEGYQYALFYIRNGEKLVSKVTYSMNGILKDTIFLQNLPGLADARKSIDKIVIENIEKLNYANNAIVILNDGRELNGKLTMFSKKDIYIISNFEDTKNKWKSDSLRISLINIDQIKIVGSSKIGVYTVFGTLIGLALLPVNAIIGGWAYVTIWVFNPIVGAIVGFIIGATLPRDEEIFIIANQSDILKLKNYAKYYFQDDESIEKKYVELE